MNVDPEAEMRKVCTHMTMSLDGYIADPNDGIDELFDWYTAGDQQVSSAMDGIEYELDGNSAKVMSDFTDNIGALVSGRRLFDIAGGWGDSHPVGAPVVCVTHTPPANVADWPRTKFVNGVEAGVGCAKELAGDKDVVIASPTISAQALDLGLVDEVHVSLVPVLLGAGIPYFSNLTKAPHRFDDPVVIPGKRATHLRYVVRR